MQPATTNDADTPSTPEPPAYLPPLYAPAAGEEALAALGPELAALAEADLLPVNVNVEVATYAALGVVGFVTSPDARPRFAELPARAFDLAVLDGLGPVCFATLRAIAEARAAGVLPDKARVPPALVAEATELERRMQALCEYHFARDPEIQPELDRLRPGTGHRDLANDLLGYARIYELRAGEVSADRMHYRDGDLERARDLAAAIIQRLSASMTPRARAAYDRYVRVWTLLNRRYDEVRATGLWLFRSDPPSRRRFPSLFAAARPNCGRPRKVGPKGADEGGVEKPA